MEMLQRNTELYQSSYSMISEEYSHFYKLNYRKVLKYFCSEVYANKDIAEDLTQETFLRLWRFFSQGAEINRAEGLLYAIAKGVRADYYRKSKLNTVNLSTVYEIPNVDLGESEVEVLQCINSLSQEKRTIINLVVRGYNASEIGAMLNIPSSTVRGRLSDARKELKRIFKRYGITL